MDWLNNIFKGIGGFFGGNQSSAPSKPRSSVTPGFRNPAQIISVDPEEERRRREAEARARAAAEAAKKQQQQTATLDALTAKALPAAKQQAWQGANLFDQIFNAGTLDRTAATIARNKAASQYQQKQGYTNAPEVQAFNKLTQRGADAGAQQSRQAIKNTQTAVDIARWLPGAGIGELGANALRGNFSGSRQADDTLLREQAGLNDSEIKKLSEDDRTKALIIAKGGLGAGILDFAGVGAGAVSKAAIRGQIKQLIKNGAKSSLQKVAKEAATRQGMKTIATNAAVGGTLGAGLEGGGAKLMGADDQTALQAAARGFVGGAFGGTAQSPFDLATNSLSRGRVVKKALRTRMAEADALDNLDAATKEAQAAARAVQEIPDAVPVADGISSPEAAKRAKEEAQKAADEAAARAEQVRQETAAQLESQRQQADYIDTLTNPTQTEAPQGAGELLPQKPQALPPEVKAANDAARQQVVDANVEPKPEPVPAETSVLETAVQKESKVAAQRNAEAQVAANAAQTSNRLDELQSIPRNKLTSEQSVELDNLILKGFSDVRKMYKSDKDFYEQFVIPEADKPTRSADLAMEIMGNIENDYMDISDAIDLSIKPDIPKTKTERIYEGISAIKDEIRRLEKATGQKDLLKRINKAVDGMSPEDKLKYLQQGYDNLKKNGVIAMAEFGNISKAADNTKTNTESEPNLLQKVGQRLKGPGGREGERGSVRVPGGKKSKADLRDEEARVAAETAAQNAEMTLIKQVNQNLRDDINATISEMKAEGATKQEITQAISELSTLLRQNETRLEELKVMDPQTESLIRMASKDPKAKAEGKALKEADIQQSKAEEEAQIKAEQEALALAKTEAKAARTKKTVKQTEVAETPSKPKEIKNETPQPTQVQAPKTKKSRNGRAKTVIEGINVKPKEQKVAPATTQETPVPEPAPAPAPKQEKTVQSAEEKRFAQQAKQTAKEIETPKKLTRKEQAKQKLKDATKTNRASAQVIPEEKRGIAAKDLTETLAADNAEKSSQSRSAVRKAFTTYYEKASFKDKKIVKDKIAKMDARTIESRASVLATGSTRLTPQEGLEVAALLGRIEHLAAAHKIPKGRANDLAIGLATKLEGEANKSGQFNSMLRAIYQSMPPSYHVQRDINKMTEYFASLGKEINITPSQREQLKSFKVAAMDTAAKVETFKEDLTTLRKTFAKDPKNANKTLKQAKMLQKRIDSATKKAAEAYENYAKAINNAKPQLTKGEKFKLMMVNSPDSTAHYLRLSMLSSLTGRVRDFVSTLLGGADQLGWTTIEAGLSRKKTGDSIATLKKTLSDIKEDIIHTWNNVDTAATIVKNRAGVRGDGTPDKGELRIRTKNNASLYAPPSKPRVSGRIRARNAANWIRVAVNLPTSTTVGLRNRRLYQLGLEEAQEFGLTGKNQKAYAEMYMHNPPEDALNDARERWLEVSSMHDNGVSRTLKRMSDALDKAGNGKDLTNKQRFATKLGARLLRTTTIPFVQFMGGMAHSLATNQNIIYNFPAAAIHATNGNPKKAVEQLSRGTWNSVKLAGLYLLFNNGAIQVTNEDADGGQAWNGPYLKIGKEFIPASTFGPAGGSVIVAMATIHQAIDKLQKGELDTDKAIQIALGAPIQAVLIASGLDNLLGGGTPLQSAIATASKAAEPEEPGQGIVVGATAFATDLATQVIPAFARDVNSMMDTNPQFNPSGLAADTKIKKFNKETGRERTDVFKSSLAQVGSGIPILSQQLPRKDGKGVAVDATKAKSTINRMFGSSTMTPEKAAFEKKYGENKNFWASEKKPTGDELAKQWETSDYDTYIRSVSIQKDLLSKDAPPSKVAELDLKINRAKVLKDNNYSFDDWEDYNKTTLDEWRAMGNDESDSYDPERYQRLYTIDKKMTSVKASDAKYHDKQKFYAKEGKGRGSGMATSVNTMSTPKAYASDADLGYKGLKTFNSAVPNLASQTAKTNLKKKISVSKGVNL